MIFSLYFRTLLSLSISFLLRAFNFKKHVHSFLSLVTTFNTTTNNATDNKLHLKCLHPNNSSTATTPIPLPPPPPVHDIDGLMVCTESIGFESIDDERVVDDQTCHEYDDDDDDSEDEYEGGCLRTAEGRENMFPPPLSSLDGNGQPSFILLPVRKNGRLQLSKVRIKRPEILYATRQDGRLRLYLVPDHQCYEEQEECEEEEEEQEELVEEEEITTKVESEEEEEEGEEETRNEEDDRVREWKLLAGDNEGIRRCHSVGDNERLIRKCHEMVNHIHYRHHLHGSHHHLQYMFGVSIA